MSEEEYISQFIYQGRTVKEWEEEAKKVKGLNEEGNPKWWKSQTMAIDGTALAKVYYKIQNKI